MGYDPNAPYNQGQPPQPHGQPPTQPSGQGQPPYGQPPYQVPTQPYGQGQYGGAPPNYAQPSQEPPQKKSRKWLWITLAIIGGVLVLGCGGCAIAAAAGIGFFASTVAGPTVTANAYYQAIKNQDYAKAYTYLDTSRVSVVNGQQVTQQAFTALAQLEDRTQGTVTNFSQTNINVNNDTATVTMSVTRNGSPYTVQLEMNKVGNDWKITRANNI